MTTTVLILLLVFQVKHLIADYYLQFPYMYQNKGAKTGWFKPLLDHSLVHAGLTVIILTVYLYSATPNTPDGLIQMATIPLMAGIFDFVTHFVTDRWKATQGVGPDTSKFWQDLGIDQMAHHIVGILIVWWIV